MSYFIFVTAQPLIHSRQTHFVNLRRNTFLYTVK